MIAVRRTLPLVLLALAVASLACSRGEPSPPAQASAAPPAADGGLSPFELENGIGPVKAAVSLGPVDEAMAEQGEKLFEAKCQLCHKLDERYVGPALRGVAERRTGAYVMNMILNPEEMYTRHPVAKALLAEHMSQMPNLGVSQDEARQLLEYLRTQGSTKTGS